MWYEKTLGKYASHEWEVVDTPAIFKSYGIIMVRNIYSGLVDVTKVTNKVIDFPITLKGNKYLLGNFLSDTAAKQL
jgi:spermidine/putrescine-binding protein